MILPAKTVFSLKDLRKNLLAFDRVKEEVDSHNASFVEKHLVSDKVYLDAVMRPDDRKFCLPMGKEGRFFANRVIPFSSPGRGLWADWKRTEPKGSPLRPSRDGRFCLP